LSTALCNIYIYIYVYSGGVFYTIFFFSIVVLQCRTALQLDAGCGVLHRNGWPIPPVWQLGGAAAVLQARSWLPKREEREAFPVGGETPDLEVERGCAPAAAPHLFCAVEMG